MKKIMLLAASSAMLLATPALAGDNGGWYLRGNAGYGAHHDAEFGSGLFTGETQSAANLAGSLGLGYEFGDYGTLKHWRLELDGDALWTDMGQIGNGFNSFAKLRTNTLMINALYDFGGSSSKLKPYLGAGIGLVQGDLDAEASDVLGEGFGQAQRNIIDNPACFGAIDGACSIHDKDSTWGYQGIVGLGIAISDSLVWDTHYSYMRADGGGLDFDSSYTPLFLDRAPREPFSGESELNSIGSQTLMTGLRLKFGAGTPPPPPPPPPLRTFECPDGSKVYNAIECPAAAPPPPPPPPPAAPTTYTCSDGVTTVMDMNNCPAPPPPPSHTCPDGSLVSDAAYCNYTPAPVASYNNCGSSNVAIFNVPVNKTPKQMPRLGTMPEFGDSHGLTPTQFYEKLKSRYNSSAMDKAYLNYLFKSMGYSNGFADANASMFSEEVMPVGTRGLLGLGEAHHYSYSILPSTDRDRQAFRIQSANGAVINFMKTCGNYMYACN